MKFIKIITCLFFIMLITERINGQEVRFLFIGKPGEILTNNTFPGVLMIYF